MTTKIISSCGMFSLRKTEGMIGMWLYYGDGPIQHLLESEYNDLELLLKTNIFE